MSKGAAMILVAATLGGCGFREFEGDEFSASHQGMGVYLLIDKRTSCEYLWSNRGGFVLRADPRGNVSPNCAASAIEARRAATAQTDAVADESAVPQGGAQ